METAVRARSRYNQSQHSCHTRYHLYSTAVTTTAVNTTDVSSTTAATTTAVTTTAVEKVADGDSC